MTYKWFALLEISRSSISFRKIKHDFFLLQRKGLIVLSDLKTIPLDSWDHELWDDFFHMILLCFLNLSFEL